MLTAWHGNEFQTNVIGLSSVLHPRQHSRQMWHHRTSTICGDSVPHPQDFTRDPCLMFLSVA